METTHPSQDYSPKLAICLACYNPSLEHITTQLDSIIQQDYTNWVCIIHDDASTNTVFETIQERYKTEPRIQYVKHTDNAGFYHNFERCLHSIPSDTDFVAFADQDDKWYPQKLSTMVAAFETSSDTQLVYHDMRIVDEQGNILAHSFWEKRKNQCKNLESLLLSNTVTGAASMFRYTLLQHALPFPSYTDGMFHDHWIACCARASGQIKFIPAALQDYIQHQHNAIGYVYLSKNKIKEQITLLWHAIKHTHKHSPSDSSYYTDRFRRLEAFYSTLCQRFTKQHIATLCPALERLFIPSTQHSALLLLMLKGLMRWPTTYFTEFKLYAYYWLHRIHANQLDKVKSSS